MEDNTILVSVIIPTYGGSKYISRAINSVLGQTYKKWELIIVDDNGLNSDIQKQTEDVVRPFLKDERIKYICHDYNKNGSAARNTGVANSSGSYIALLDDDDEYRPKFIEILTHELTKLPEEYALAYCSHVTYYNGKQFETIHALKSGNLLFENLSHRIEIATTSVLIRKEAFISIGGFDESFRRHQDWEFLARIASQFKIKAVDFIGYNRYLEWRNVPADAAKAKTFRLHYLEKMRPYIALLPAKQQREVIVGNRLDVALWYIKEKKYGDFIREYKSIKPGLFVLSFVFNRIRTKINRIRRK